MRFGTQRATGDWFAMLVMMVGFFALAVAFLFFTASYLGLLLPLAYLIGLFGALRTEVRELEIQPGRLLVRTFFKTYPMPREHIVRIEQTLRGPAVDVLNGSRYAIAPPESDYEQVSRALEEWWTVDPVDKVDPVDNVDTVQ